MSREAHHAHGPSTLDSLSRCVRFKYKDSGDGSADEGTMLHEAYETGNLAGLNDEQARCVTLARDYTESVKFEDGLSAADWEDMAEIRIEVTGLTYGRTDRVLYCRSRGWLEVLDAKFTRVEKSHTDQLRTYAAGFIEMNPHSPVTRLRTHVVAPRLGPPDVVEHDPSTIVAEVRSNLERLYARIEDPFEPPTPHEDLCAKCARAGRCPALGKLVVTASRNLGLPLPSSFAPDAPVSDRDRAIGQVLAGVFENWAEQVKQNNTAFVASGGTIPGFRKAVRSSGLRVPKERTADAVAALKGMLPEEDILGCCSLTLGDVSKQVAFTKGLTEAEARELVRESLAGIAADSSYVCLQKEKRVKDLDMLNELVGNVSEARQIGCRAGEKE